MYQVTIACVTLPRFYLDRSRTIGRRRFVMEVLAVRKIAMYLSFFCRCAVLTSRCATQSPGQDVLSGQNNYVWRAGAGESTLSNVDKNDFFYDWTDHKKDAFIHSPRNPFFTPRLILLPFEWTARMSIGTIINFWEIRARRSISVRKLWNTYSVFVLSPYFKSYFANLFRFSDV